MSTTSPPKKLGIISILKESFRLWGIKGPFRGLLVTILRDTPSFGMYFLTYEALMLSGNSKNIPPNADLYTEFERYIERYGYYPQNISISQCLSSTSAAQQEQIKVSDSPPLFLTLFAGAMSGVMSWVITYPFDVIKTRIQSTPLEIKANGIIQIFSKLLKNEGGIKSLFCGLNATVIRAIPTNAIIFLGFSSTLRMLETSKE